MSAGSIEGLELDRTKAVWEMHREYCYEQNDGHRYRRERNKRPEQNENPPDNFDNDGGPAKQKGGRNPHGVQYIDEVLRAPGQLRIAMLQEAKSDNQPKRNGVPCRRSGAAERSQVC